MQVEVEITKKEKTAVEATFPVYVSYGDSFDSGGGYDSYARIDESMTEYVVTKNYDGEWEYKIFRADSRTIGKIFAPDLYRGDYSGYSYDRITADKFFAKVEELRAALSAIPR